MPKLWAVMIFVGILLAARGARGATLLGKEMSPTLAMTIGAAIAMLGLILLVWTAEFIRLDGGVDIGPQRLD